MNTNSIFKSKLPPQILRGFQSHAEQNQLMYVNACMHVDTGTDLHLVSNFVCPRPGDKSILGTELAQTRQVNRILKKNSVRSQINSDRP